MARRVERQTDPECLRLVMARLRRLRGGELSSRAADPHALTRYDAVLPTVTGIDFEHVCRWAANRSGLIIEHGNLLENTGDRSIRGDEQHVERNAGVVHPEGVNGFVWPRKQHSALRRELGAIHQAVLLLFVRQRHFDFDGGLGATEEFHRSAFEGWGWRRILRTTASWGCDGWRWLREWDEAGWRCRREPRGCGGNGRRGVGDWLDGGSMVGALAPRYCGNEQQKSQSPSEHERSSHTMESDAKGRNGHIADEQNRSSGGILAPMRRLTIHLCSVVLAVNACGGPSAPLPKPRGKGGSAGVPTTDTMQGGVSAAAGGASAYGGTTGKGGTTSTYVEPGCPTPPVTEFDTECDALDPASCPFGDGCYPTIIYPTARCEPEIYSTMCLPAGSGAQWDDCLSLTDCAPGFICVVGGIGTQCQRACDSSDPTSCPRGLFCEAIDLPGIGTCY